MASVGGKGTFNSRFRIARQLRHVARVQEVAFGVIDFESGAVHELLCARVVFNATSTNEVHRDFCHRLVAAKICGIVEREAQATLYVVFRGNREIRRRKLVRRFVPHGEHVVAGEESLRFEIRLSCRKCEFTNEVLRVAIHDLHFQRIVVETTRQQPVGTTRRVADAVRLRYAAVVQVAHGRMSDTEFRRERLTSIFGCDRVVTLGKSLKQRVFFGDVVLHHRGKGQPRSRVVAREGQFGRTCLGGVVQANIHLTFSHSTESVVVDRDSGRSILVAYVEVRTHLAVAGLFCRTHGVLSGRQARKGVGKIRIVGRKGLNRGVAISLCGEDVLHLLHTRHFRRLNFHTTGTGTACRDRSNLQIK